MRKFVSTNNNRKAMYYKKNMMVHKEFGIPMINGVPYMYDKVENNYLCYSVSEILNMPIDCVIDYCFSVGLRVVRTENDEMFALDNYSNRIIDIKNKKIYSIKHDNVFIDTVNGIICVNNSVKKIVKTIYGKHSIGIGIIDSTEFYKPHNRIDSDNLAHYVFYNNKGRCIFGKEKYVVFPKDVEIYTEYYYSIDSIYVIIDNDDMYCFYKDNLFKINKEDFVKPKVYKSDINLNCFDFITIRNGYIEDEQNIYKVNEKDLTFDLIGKGKIYNNSNYMFVYANNSLIQVIDKR